MAGFLLGSAGMFATLYSTQAILPELGRSFHVGPARAGLTVSAVVVAIAVGVWVWGPCRTGSAAGESLLLASAALVPPTVAAGLAPTFEVLLACRALQGLCMPGLLVVGVPYVMEAFGPWLGGLAMGVYVSSLVLGGLIGRVGVALVASAVGWRWAVGGVAVFPAAAFRSSCAAGSRTSARPRGAGWRGGGTRRATPKPAAAADRGPPAGALLQLRRRLLVRDVPAPSSRLSASARARAPSSSCSGCWA